MMHKETEKAGGESSGLQNQNHWGEFGAVKPYLCSRCSVILQSKIG